MTDKMLADLAEVVRLSDAASDDMPWSVDEEGDIVCNGEDVAWAITNKLDAPYIAAMNNLLRAHHATIAQNAESAKRLKALEQAIDEIGTTGISDADQINIRADEIMRGGE